MEEILKQIFSYYGPEILPWVIAAACGFYLWRERKPSSEVYKEHIKTYKDLADSYHDAVLENSKVIERLAILIEERTRTQNEYIRRKED